MLSREAWAFGMQVREPVQDQGRIQQGVLQTQKQVAWLKLCLMTIDLMLCDVQAAGSTCMHQKISL